MADTETDLEYLNAHPGRIVIGTHDELVLMRFERACLGFGIEPAIAANMALALVNAAASRGYDWATVFEAARAEGKLVDPAAAAPRRWGDGQAWGQPPANDTPS